MGIIYIKSDTIRRGFLLKKIHSRQQMVGFFKKLPEVMGGRTGHKQIK
jgi:hypothetical protein